MHCPKCGAWFNPFQSAFSRYQCCGCSQLYQRPRLFSLLWGNVAGAIAILGHHYWPGWSLVLGLVIGLPIGYALDWLFTPWKLIDPSAESGKGSD
jgi:hypothetical protein